MTENYSPALMTIKHKAIQGIFSNVIAEYYSLFYDHISTCSVSQKSRLHNLIIRITSTYSTFARECKDNIDCALVNKHNILAAVLFLCLKCAQTISIRNSRLFQFLVQLYIEVNKYENRY